MLVISVCIGSRRRDRTGKNASIYQARCDCGGTAEVIISDLWAPHRKTGRKSCGCLRGIRQKKQIEWNKLLDAYITEARKRSYSAAAVAQGVAEHTHFDGKVTRNIIIGRWYRLGLTLPEKVSRLRQPPPHGSCLFPIGDPVEENFGYCGAYSEHGDYCNQHRQVVYKQKRKTSCGGQSQFPQSLPQPLLPKR